MTHDRIVVAALSLEDDVAPPAEHGEQDARDADGQNRRAEPRPHASNKMRPNADRNANAAPMIGQGLGSTR